jgi:hypothetical protein
MRAVAVIPAYLLAVMLIAPGHHEPNERAMQAAFEDALSVQVRNALDFAAETGGPDAVATIRARGHDRFTVNAFQKVKCEREVERDGYLCEFSVDIGLANGPMQKTISGRFQPDGDRLVFVQDV